MSVPKVVVHTDVFIDHLTGLHSPSLLRLAMARFFCYTTVYQAIELFSFAASDKEVQAVEDSMAAIKVLGLNPKGARRYGELLRSRKNAGHWNVLIAGLCLESRLPILTDRHSEFAGFKDLTIVPTKFLMDDLSGEEILRVTRKDKRKS